MNINEEKEYKVIVESLPDSGDEKEGKVEEKPAKTTKESKPKKEKKPYEFTEKRKTAVKRAAEISLANRKARKEKLKSFETLFGDESKIESRLSQNIINNLLKKFEELRVNDKLTEEQKKIMPANIEVIKNIDNVEKALSGEEAIVKRFKELKQKMKKKSQRTKF